MFLFMMAGASLFPNMKENSNFAISNTLLVKYKRFNLKVNTLQY